MSGNKNVLLTWSSNWADEMDIQLIISEVTNEMLLSVSSSDDAEEIIAMREK